MKILFDEYNRWIIIRLENEDWKDDKAKKFLQDIKELPEEQWIFEEENNLWKIDFELAKKFKEIFKKHYGSSRTKNQKVLCYQRAQR